MGGSSEEVERLHSWLTSTKTSERRTGISKLVSWLEVKDFLLQLDETTLSLSQLEQVTQSQASWPAVCHSLCKAVSLELASSGSGAKAAASSKDGRRRSGAKDDLQVASSLRAFVTAAENAPQRSKLLNPLQRKSRKLFATVTAEVERRGLSSVAGKELNELLRLHLLRQPVYCGNVDSVIKQKLAVLYARWLNRDNYREHKEEFYRNADTLGLVLLSLPGDICKAVRSELRKFFCSAFKFLDNYTKVGHSVFRTLNAFLRGHSLDLCGEMDLLCQPPYRFARSTWERSRHKGYRLALCEFVELDLLCGGGDGRGPVLGEILRCVSRDLESAGTDAFLAEVCGTRQYIRTAALVARNVLGLECEPAGGGDGVSPQKRQRRGLWSDELWDEAMASPAKWGAALCVLLGSHSRGIPVGVLKGWLVALHSRLSQLESSFLSGKSNEGLLWLMRIVNHLSQAFWEQTSKGQDAEAEDVWNDIYGKITRWLVTSSFTQTTGMDAEALMILSNISLLGNVPCYSVEEVLRARPWGDRGNIQLVLFLGASLCLPNKKVRLNLEENLKDLPTLVCTSAKEAISDSQSELWQRALARMIFTMSSTMQDYGSIKDLREVSRSMSISWFTSKGEDDVGLGEGFEHDLSRRIFRSRTDINLEKHEGRTSCNFRSSSLVTEILSLFSTEVAAHGAKQIIMWCGALAKTAIHMKSMGEGEGSDGTSAMDIDGDKENETEIGVNETLRHACMLLPKAVGNLLSSSSCVDLMKSISEINGALADLNLLAQEMDLKSLLIQPYNGLAQVISHATTKMLRSYDPYHSLHSEKENLDLEFEDSGSKRVSSFLSDTLRCIELLSATLEKIGLVCPECAYQTLCEMRANYEFDLGTEIVILSSMCWVGLHLADMPKDPLMDLCRIQQMRQNLPAQHLVLERFQAIFERADKAHAMVLYDSAIQLVKGIERWMLDNESTASLRICLGKMLQILIRVDAVTCHEEGLDEILLVLLRDEYYMVRLEAAKQIGTLFDAWQDHLQVFTTISGYLMLPPCQDVIQTSDCQPEDVEETLSSIFALGFFAAKSKKIELYGVIMICTTMISKMEDKLVLKCALDVLSELAGRFGYSLSQYLKYFQSSLLASLRVEVLLSESFSKFASTFLLKEGSSKRAFAGDVIACIGKKDPAELMASFGLADFFGESEDTMRSWALRLMMDFRKRDDCEKGAMEYASEYLEAESSLLPDQWNILENMAILISTILECVVHSAPLVSPCLDRSEGHNMIFALLEKSRGSASATDRATVSYFDSVFSLALRRLKVRVDSTSFHHKENHIYAIGILADLLEDFECTWNGSVNYAIRVCTQHLESTDMAQRIPLEVLDRLICIRTTKGGNQIDDLLVELYITIARLSSCAPKEGNKVKGKNPLSLLMTGTVLCILDSLASAATSGVCAATTTLCHCRNILERSSFETSDFFSKAAVTLKGLDCARCRRPQYTIEYLWENSVKRGLLPSDVLSTGVQCSNVFSLDDLCIADEIGEGKLRYYCLDLIRKYAENLSMDATAALTKILNLLGPSNSSAVPGIRFSGNDVERLAGKISNGGKILSVTDREYNKVRISLEVMNFLYLWMSDEDPTLAYESLRSAVWLKSSKYARVACREMSKDSKRLMLQIWNIPREKIGIHVPTVRHQGEDSPADTSSWDLMSQTVNDGIHAVVKSLIPFCKTEVLHYCKDLIDRIPEVGKSILPLMIEDIALHYPSDSRVCKQLGTAIEQHVVKRESCSTSVVDIFLSVFERLRAVHSSYQKHSKHDRLKWSTCFWFGMNYLDVADLAFSRKQYFTALLYVEQWYEMKFGTFTDHGKSKRGDVSDSSTSKSLKGIESMLINIFKGVGESDSLYAFATNVDLETQLRIFEHEGKWDKALQTYDILLSSNSGRVQDCPEDYVAGMANCMKSLGCSYLANLYENEARPAKVTLSEEQFERAWQQCIWTLPAIDLNVTERPNLNQSIYNCLYALRVKDTDFFEASKTLVHKCAVKKLCQSGPESTVAANESIIVLQMVDLLSKSCEENVTSGVPGLSPGARSNPSRDGTLLKFNKIGAYNVNELVDRHNLLKPIFKLYASVLTAIDCKRGLTTAHLYEAKVSRETNNLTQGTSSMGVVKQLCRVCKLDESFEIGVRIEEMKNLWDQGLERLALNECKKLYTMLECRQEKDPKKMGEAFLQFSETSALLGKWLTLTGSESLMEIQKILSVCVNYACMGHEHFQKYTSAENASHQIEESHAMICRAHFNLAEFCDKQYRAIEREQSSPQWQARQRLLAHTDKQLDLMTKKKGSRRSSADKDFLLYKATAARFHEQDQREALAMESRKMEFLRVALSHYKSTLVKGKLHNNKVAFRVCQLWFKLSDNEDVLGKMAKLIEEVPSHKFLCLMYQIGSRLGPSKGGLTFESTVTKLLTKMCFDHPHHTLPHIFAFANAGRGKDGTTKDSKNNSGYAVDKTKVLAANAILQKVRKRTPALYEEYLMMINACISLAVLQVKKTGGDPLDPHMPRSAKELMELPNVPILTTKVRVDETCRYEAGHFEHFVSFRPEVKLVGGINAPKLVRAIDSSGREHLQLAKSGNDDLRQDAVMQQLFNLVNHLLGACAKTRRRQLGLQTYNVVPLTPAAGLVEWVERSTPLMKYLVGESGASGAHRRLRPQDWTYQQCLAYLYKQQNARATTKREAFSRICKNFRPVMHHFFLEHYPDTSEWFQKRLAYTRSIAASSMVGYVVGLGDRHASNILIHTDTAEVIHIDLGIAFEQGRVLKIPETVPFRLTRDVVDGMGVSGVEGTMRRCSE